MWHQHEHTKACRTCYASAYANASPAVVYPMKYPLVNVVKTVKVDLLTHLNNMSELCVNFLLSLYFRVF